MARYTCSYTVAIPLDQLQSAIGASLQACHCEIIYQGNDFIMARESPGQIAFTKLVTVEVSIDRITAPAGNIKLSLVVKNEELPLQAKNHCQEMFSSLQEAIEQQQQWQLLDKAAS